MKIGIVGAGVTGLTAAYELGKRGHRVTIYETEPTPGGLSSGFRVPEWEWTLDRFYRHAFAGDRELIAQCRELGVQLAYDRPKTSRWVNGRPYVYDNMVGVARYPNLPFLTNIRLGLVVAYLKFLVRKGTRLERTTAHRWTSRAMGKRGYGQVWEPMLRGKFKEHFDKVNMAWFWARLAARTPRLGYVDGGFQAWIDRLAEAVREQGGKVCLSTPASQIAQAGKEVAITMPGGRTEVYGKVLTTTSPTKVTEMVARLPAGYVNRLSDLKSTGAVVLILALDRSILSDGTYWLNLPQGEFPCLSVVEHTNYQDKEHYNGDVIVYLGDYLSPDAPEMQADTDELYALYRPALSKIQPEFDDSWVRAKWSFRETYAQPVPEVNHSQLVPELETPVQNLYWACMHHVYPWDRGTNYAVELGQRVARLMDR